MADMGDSPGLEDKVTSEAVSVWMRDLSEIILVQRARVRRLTAKSPVAETEKRKLESHESLLRDAIIAYYSRVKKMSLTGDRSGIREALHVSTSWSH